ncbi:hypothetical protein K0C01_11185 [Salinarchaeum sp. IM2453]|uniref:hypothetical protein n=1 Tax=Salinarchaeum sp. IM2453 TaxID=2862870 RepID=UPI001C839DEB|nr:hypothetical protein [Salinarchaeum sp. IM2453]QZA88334.1 hypothetical protein K0C01_11185 [Salinarchaeum sp. IM2453]
MSSIQEKAEQVPYGAGAIFGVGAYLFSYILIFALVFIGEDELSDDIVDASGWILYNAQFVDIEISSEEEVVDDIFDDTTINYVTEASVELPSLVYHLVPILVLLSAGFILVTYADIDSEIIGIMSGASIVSGTVVLAVLGTFVFEITETVELADVDVTYAPPLLESIIFVGILFPVIFGAIGGLVATQVES